MSSFYDDASLVVIPSGYKTSKVYAEKPTDGSGDLAFTRTGDTATRVNSAGLIEKVRTNQYFKSTAFTTSSIFSTYNTSPTSLGTFPVYSDSLAYSFPITGTNQGFIFSVGNDSQIRAISIYLKDFGTLDLYWTGSAPLSYGATSEVINGYTRYLVVIPAGANNIYFRPNGNAGTATTVYATAPQIEYGDIATAYISNSTTASVVSVGPVANVPRLDYLGSTCPRLLLEPQRTNIAVYSEQFDNIAGWTLYNGTQVANTTETLDPSGYYGAEKVIMGVTNSATYRKTIGGLTNGDTYTFSLYIKQGSGVTAFLDICDSSTTPDITPTSSWVRYTKTGVWNTSLNFVDIELRGTSGSFCYIWGAQLEAGAYATSYIPTLAASATRGKDNCIKTSASALIGQTEGTVFVEFQINGQSLSEDLYSNNKNGTGGISIQIGTNDRVQGYVLYAGTYIEMLSAVGAVPKGQTNKVAIAYKSGASALYVNGVQVATSATAFAFTSTLSEIDIANDSAYFAHLNNKVISQVLQFKTRLTNAELAELTTL